MAYTATASNYSVLLRLSSARAQRLERNPCGTWSIVGLHGNPARTTTRVIRGRLLVRQVPPNNAARRFLLALFTTLALPEQEVLTTYGHRWNIETDLRTLKSSLRLDQLTCFSPDMVAKEIEMGITACNLVRAVTCLASDQSGLPPRGYSFTRVRRIVETFAPLVAAAPNASEAKRRFDQVMHYGVPGRCWSRETSSRNAKADASMPQKLCGLGEGAV